MSWNAILAIYIKELKDSLRDRRTILSIVIIPTFIVPAMVFGVLRTAQKVVATARIEVPAIQIIGGEDSPAVVAAIKASPKFQVMAPAQDWKQKISDKKLRAAVLIPPHFEQDLKAGHPDEVVIYHYSGEIKSGFASEELANFFANLRQKTIKRRLADRNLPADLVEPFTTREENVAAPEKVGGNTIGGFIPYLIIVLCFTGAMYPAMDLTAGEKERGTMETLLCSPVGRLEIVLGKFLMVLTGSLSAMVLALSSMALTATVAAHLFGSAMGRGGPAGGMISIDPLGIIGTLGMIAPISILFSSVLLTVSLFARSFREAQSYVAPMIFLIILPAVIGMLPGSS